MGLLKKENAWVWLLLMFLTNGASIFMLGALLGVYKNGAWYSKWYYWVLGIITVLPALIMIMVLFIYTLTKVCDKLKVAGRELYILPYPWVVCIIVPVIGWALFIVLLLYLTIWHLVKLFQGNGEKYIDLK